MYNLQNLLNLTRITALYIPEFKATFNKASLMAQSPMTALKLVTKSDSKCRKYAHALFHAIPYMCSPDNVQKH